VQPCFIPETRGSFQPRFVSALDPAYIEEFAPQLFAGLMRVRPIFLLEDPLGMKRCLSTLLAIVFFASSLATADEGMWLYNAPPKDKIKAKYGFELTQEWLDHVRLSSVRFNNGGSGSFVSADGLTFTNHHVGAACVQQLSTEGHDYIKTGF
jgi:hypothetical protein